MGRKKLPAEVKNRRGTYRKDRDAEPAELARDWPPPPEDLHPKASQEWTRLAPILSKAGLLTEVDWLAWELGMAAYDTWLRVSEQLPADMVVWTDKGNAVQHPLVSIAGKAWQSVIKFCREFGLTPSARSGLKLATPAEQDPFAAHIAGS